MASPFLPSHKRRFVANRVFTDRERPVTQFLRAFDSPPPAEAHRVLVFYGVGGEGKTALARHLRGLLEKDYARHAGWAAVNFEDAAMRRPAEALLSLRLQLRQTAGLAFPAFDTAFAHWFGRTYPGASVRERHPELFRQPSEVGGDAFDVGLDVLKDIDGIIGDTLGEIPGLGLIWKYGNRFHGRFREWWERRGKEVLRGIEALQPDQLLDRLPAFLGADLGDAIAAMPAGRRRPLTVIADTVEAFHRGEAQQGGGFAFRNDRRLRELIKETPGVLFVLLGRDRLRWAEIEPEWAQVLEQHRLGALSPDDAEAYLRAIPVTEPEVRARMVQGAQGLPFYLDLQVDLYETLRNQGHAPDPAQFGGSEPEIIQRFLDHLGAAAARALAVLAHCRRFDEPLWLHLGREFLGGLPPFAFGDLAHFSFVEELGEGWLGLHALMREALTERTSRSEPILHERLQRGLFAWWDERCRPADLRSVAPAHEVALEEAALHRATFDPNSLGDWARERGKPFYHAARYDVAHRLFEMVLTVEEAALPKDDPKLAHSLSWLGVLLELRGESEQALERQKRALAILKRAYGLAHPQVAMTLSNLGNIYQVKGQIRRAMKYQTIALSILERAYGPDHLEVAVTLGSIANLYQVSGELHHAIEYQERALAVLERIFGLDNPEVARALGNLGVILTDSGKFDQAMKHQERALAIKESTYGPNHPEVAITLSNLGVAHQFKGDLPRAIKFQERARVILEQVHGPNHPDVARAISNLGILHQLGGQPTRAIEFHERALAIMECAYGPNHPDVASILGQLGNTLLDMGELNLAKERMERALAIKERAHGLDHPEVARALGNLGVVYKAIGAFDEAIERHKRALLVLEHAYGPDHPDVAKTLGNLGDILQRKGELDGALEHVERALAINERSFGPDQPEVAGTLIILGMICQCKGEFSRAIESLERALTINERCYGPDHQEAAFTMHKLALVARKAGLEAIAHQRMQAAVNGFERRLGAGHPRTEAARRELVALDTARLKKPSSH